MSADGPPGLPFRQRAHRLRWRAAHAADRLRLGLQRRLHPGLEVHPTASAHLAGARIQLGPGARLRIGARLATERRPGRLHVLLHEGAEVEIGDDVWLRTEVAPVTLVAYAGARLRVGPECFLNGCFLSAKREVTLARRVFVGMGTRILDADQHDLDAERPERIAPVRVDEHAWIAADATVLRGVAIGAHSVVGARSLVTRDVPPHTLVVGVPAHPVGRTGDRTHAR